MLQRTPPGPNPFFNGDDEGSRRRTLRTLVLLVIVVTLCALCASWTPLLDALFG